MKTIIGGGLAGLIAAHAWPQATILEAAPGPVEAHKALLRFRSDGVARLTGVEFRRVRVHKGIWSEGGFVAPNIRVANLYSSKVLGSGKLAGRSIWSLDPVDRFIAPETFYEQLVESVGSRIHWGESSPHWSFAQPVVNTAPLPVVLAGLEGTISQPPVAKPDFQRQPITVKRWRLPDSDVFQTVYFPDADTALYRASITKDLLIAEFAGEPMFGDEYAFLLQQAFGIPLDARTEQLPDVNQRYGKIAPIPDDVRKKILFWLTHEHNVYSLGRFATWRNVLLDDVVDDIDMIKRMSRSGSYDLRKSS